MASTNIVDTRSGTNASETVWTGRVACWEAWQGLLLQARVHPADLQDRAAVPLLLEGAADRFPQITLVWADQGYTGSGRAWIEDHLGWQVSIVQHPPQPRGRWVPHGDLSDLSTV